MAVTADVIPRRPTLFFIVVLGMLLVLMSLSSRTRPVGETRTLFERTALPVFSPVPQTVNAVGQPPSDAYHGSFDLRRAVAEKHGLEGAHVDLHADNLTQ